MEKCFYQWAHLSQGHARLMWRIKSKDVSSQTDLSTVDGCKFESDESIKHACLLWWIKSKVVLSSNADLTTISMLYQCIHPYPEYTFLQVNVLISTFCLNSKSICLQ